MASIFLNKIPPSLKWLGRLIFIHIFFLERHSGMQIVFVQYPGHFRLARQYGNAAVSRIQSFCRSEESCLMPLIVDISAFAKGIESFKKGDVLFYRQLSPSLISNLSFK